MSNHDFTIPDLTASPGGSGAFISAKQGAAGNIGVSQGAIDRLGIEDDQRVILAFDEDNRPWVGFVPQDQLDDPELVGPCLHVYEDDKSLSSKPMQRALRGHLPNGERRRFYLLPETDTVEVEPGVETTLHRLSLEDGQDE